MDIARFKEAYRLNNLIEDEGKAKKLLCEALHGFVGTEVECCDIYISAYWKKGTDVSCMHEDNSLNAARVRINGEIAQYLVQQAVDKLESSIDFHEKQLKEL